jgi:hypothetical protein
MLKMQRSVFQGETYTLMTTKPEKSNIGRKKEFPKDHTLHPVINKGFCATCHEVYPSNVSPHVH